MSWLAGLLGGVEPGKPRWPGRDLALDGATSVALAESCWSEAACLGATFPASVSARAWRAISGAGTVFGVKTSAIESASPGGALGAAIGAALAGRRAVVFVSGEDLGGLAGQLRRASGSRTPLVVHVATRAVGAQGVSFGGGHDSWHAVSDAGCAMLFAVNAQEAVDLALVARRAAEWSLTPVLIGMDGPETALAMQEVRLPEPALVGEVLGVPTLALHAPTEAQRMLFGESRRRVPAWHDPDEPAMLGAVVTPRSGGSGPLGEREFFGRETPGALGEAMRVVAEGTGRALAPILTDRVEHADLVIVAMGAAVETAQAAAALLREKHQAKVGVLGIRQLRPWPGEEIVAALRRAKRALVVERVASPLAGPGPLTREVLASLAGAGSAPRVSTARHGVGGPIVRASELIEACRAALADREVPALLGVGLAPTATTTPRQRVVLDATRRAAPELSAIALRAALPDAPIAGTTSVAVVRRGGPADEPASGLIASVLHGLVGGRLRSCPSIDVPRAGLAAVDRLAFGVGAVTPASDPADVVALVSWPCGHRFDPLGLVRDGGVLVVALDPEGAAPEAMSREVLERAGSRGVTVIGARTPAARAYEHPEPAWRRHEVIAGVVASVVERRHAGDSAGTTRAEKARRGVAGSIASGEIEDRLGLFLAAYREAGPVEPAACAPRAFDRGTARRDGGPPFTGQPVKDPGTCWALEGEPVATGRDESGFLNPFASTGATPARSCAPRGMAPADEMLVEFDAASWDGDPMLWTGCADGSIAARALDLGAILRAGVELSGQLGRPADGLAPVIGPLSRAAHKAALGLSSPSVTVADLCEPVWPGVAAKIAEDRREGAAGAFAAVMAAVGSVPLVRTPGLFDSRESAKPGSGVFLTIGSDPDRCVHAAGAAGGWAGRGLRLVARTAEVLGEARARWRVFEALPDSSGEVVEWARGVLGPMAAAMLWRGGEGVLSSGDEAEPGSGSRLALRQVLAACESVMTPRVAAFASEVEGLRARLAEAVHGTLAGAVPDHDLDALAEGLEGLEREDVDLIELGRRVANAAERPHLDAARLRRLVDAARELADLSWRLGVGPTGRGRARFGGAIGVGPGTMWAGSGPFNPFGAPVVVDASAWTPELARGLFDGHAAVAARAAEVVRHARAVLEQPGIPRAETRLSWSDLTAAERSACPPMLLIGDDESLTRGSLGSLMWLLESGAPVKVVLLSGASGPVETGWGVDALGAFPAGSGAEASLLALLSRRAFVVQGSVAAPDHLAEGVARALAFEGPALIAVHAPSPDRHGFNAARTVSQARLAVESRVWPLLVFDPSAGGVFGSCLDLGGNPGLDRTWSDAGVTPLDWAVTEGRFRRRFRALGSEPAMGAARAIETAPDERVGVAVRVVDPLDRSAWAASDDLVSFAVERMRLWRTLQEIAGVVTPFTDRVREQAAVETAAAHEKEIAALKRMHERAMQDLRAGFEAEAVARVREGLMSLAGYGGGERGGEEP
jgi:pyruvate-ferredoxin/flavodoxin oxidoreductase